MDWLLISILVILVLYLLSDYKIHFYTEKKSPPITSTTSASSSTLTAPSQSSSRSNIEQEDRNKLDNLETATPTKNDVGTLYPTLSSTLVDHSSDSLVDCD